MYMWTTNHAIPTDVNAFLAAYIYIIYHNVYTYKIYKYVLIFYACVSVGSIQESLLLLHRWLQYSSGRTGVCEITSSHFYIIYVCARVQVYIFVRCTILCYIYRTRARRIRKRLRIERFKTDSDQK